VRRTDATTGGGDWRMAVVQRARAGGGCGNPFSSGSRVYAHAASMYHWVVRSAIVQRYYYYYYHYSLLPAAARLPSLGS